MPDVREKLVELQLQADIADNVSENTTQHREFTADFMMANGVTVQEWIPVTERLPEPPRIGDKGMFYSEKIELIREMLSNYWESVNISEDSALALINAITTVVDFKEVGE